LISFLKNKKVRNWCFFDFGISSFPTLVLTFFYGAFYARHIVGDITEGTSLWGFSLSLGSLLAASIFLLILFISSSSLRKINVKFFAVFFFILIMSSSSLFFFNSESNKYYPLVLVVLSFIAFEVVNLFYNISLDKVATKTSKGSISNLGWGFGYFGGFLALLVVLISLKFVEGNTQATPLILMLIGPFVGLWTLVFGYPHLSSLKKSYFSLPIIKDTLEEFRPSSLGWFIISYFFFNNGVVCIFAFASMFSSFLFGLSESEILLMGVFINLSGILGCLILGRFDDRLGSEKCVLLCIIMLTLLSGSLFLVKDTQFFWFIAILIGFFIGPIQASSRSFISKKIKGKSQLSVFSFYSFLGNICSVIGPLAVGLLINFTDSIRLGMLIIPLFFIISLIPYTINRK
jgi:UMF1 family MFS transporter